MHRGRLLGAQVVGGEHDLEGAQDRARRDRRGTRRPVPASSPPRRRARAGWRRSAGRGRSCPSGRAAPAHPSGSTRMSAMFWTSRTSCTPLRTSSSGLKRADSGAGGIEQQAVREPGAPAGGELPVLALDVVDDGRAGPGQERGQHQAHALARSGSALRPGRAPDRRGAGSGCSRGRAPRHGCREDRPCARRKHPPSGPSRRLWRPLAAGPPGGSPDGDGAAQDAAEGGGGAGAGENVRAPGRRTPATRRRASRARRA